MNIILPKEWRKAPVQERIVDVEHLRLILEAGMIVKFGGCRDGKGLREIIEINGDSVVGRKLDLKHLYKKPEPGKKWGKSYGFQVVKSTYMSSNGLDKLQMYYDNELGHFVKVKF